MLIKRQKIHKILMQIFKIIEHKNLKKFLMMRRIMQKILMRKVDFLHKNCLMIFQDKKKIHRRQNSRKVLKMMQKKASHLHKKLISQLDITMLSFGGFTPPQGALATQSFLRHIESYFLA